MGLATYGALRQIVKQNILNVCSSRNRGCKNTSLDSLGYTILLNQSCATTPVQFALREGRLMLLRGNCYLLCTMERIFESIGGTLAEI